MTIETTSSAIQSAQALRESSKYSDTQKIFTQQGLTAEVLNQTPPVGLNLLLLQEMPIMKNIKDIFNGQLINSAILGIAIADGVPDFDKFLQTALGCKWRELTVFDLDPNILHKVQDLAIKNKLSSVNIIQKDVRHTELDANSLHLTLRDHIDNCCPPGISRGIQPEVARITSPGGISIVNITTSESLSNSNKEIISFNKLSSILASNTMNSLQQEIFTLSELKINHGDHLEAMRGKILEIEPNGSFVIFGEDQVGHGEWFRKLEDHQQSWFNSGFDIIGMKIRVGQDSHIPPLSCLRHNVVLQKKHL